jgi:leukotriene-A4 hydrolase
MLEASASELVDMEKMVEAAEALYGPYRWGRYDVLVLPPSFPFGGMENPRLTFATPTILAGDRSLVSLIAHELAHSWSGNLVTNAVWADFWVNEGFTTYFENRIMESLYGTTTAGMLQTLGWSDWMSDMADLGGPTGLDTRLKVDLAGRDPDDGTTDIAYEKGAAFLRMVERTVGRERFDAWLRAYFDRYAFQPMTTEVMLADMRANLIKGDAELERRLMIDAWVYQPGVPANAVEPTSTLFVTADAMASKYANGLTTARGIYVDGWSTQEWQRFLTSLPRQLTRAQLDELEAQFHLNEAGNSEIRFLWLKLAIANRYDPAVPSLEQFLTSQGRRKFVAPLFTDLMAQGDWGQSIARRIYAKARSGYHPVTTNTVDEIVPR